MSQSWNELLRHWRSGFGLWFVNVIYELGVWTLINFTCVVHLAFDGRRFYVLVEIGLIKACILCLFKFIIYYV